MKSKKQPNHLRQSLGVFRYSGRAINLVWTTSQSLTMILASLSLLAGLLPEAIAYIGKLIVNAVVLASQTNILQYQLQYLPIIDNGETVEQRTHQQLLAADRLYARLFTKKLGLKPRPFDK